MRFGKPLDFSRYEGMAGDRFVERSMTDEIMYELMQLSGQEYVDVYAAKVKKAAGQATSASARRRRREVGGRCATAPTGCRTSAPEPVRFFYDCEFIEDGRTIDLVSIGVVDEDGREFYAVSTEFDPARAIDWVRRNVLDKLPPPADPAWRSLRADPRRPAGVPAEPGEPIELWAWMAAYDHVVLPSCGATCARCRGRSRGSPTSCGSGGRTPARRRCRRRRRDQHDALADARHNLARWRRRSRARLATGVVATATGRQRLGIRTACASEYSPAAATAPA